MEELRMDWMYLFYFLFAVLLFFGARYAGRGKWHEDFTSLEQSGVLKGITAMLVSLHHMGQKTCGSWHPRPFIVHGLDIFVPVGYLFVGVFFFCSGMGLYRSLHSKKDYLKGFARRRIAPLVIAFYLSEIIYTLVRLAMGEKMSGLKIFWYLSGLHLANVNAWYLVTITFLYLVFWVSFRRCKSEGRAILWIVLFCLAYSVLGAFIGRQDKWWMTGEWWYNSVFLFPLGLLFGKHEQKVTAFLKKRYGFFLPISFIMLFVLFWLSETLNGTVWGYFDAWNDPMKVPHRLMSAGLQWLVALDYTAFCFLLLMKVKLNNGALRFLGRISLSYYLMHGLFVELFGFNFMDISGSLFYIRNVALNILVVLSCTILSSVAFNWIWRKAVDLMLKRSPAKQNAV